MTHPIVIDVSSSTHVGAKRTENEDRVLVAHLEERAAHVGPFAGRLEVRSGGALFAVCDGMGGEAGGEVASSTAVAALFREAVTALPGRSREVVARGVLDAVQTASREIEQLAAAQVELGRMGTTATVCAVTDEGLVVAQVGDSRAYLLRGGRLIQLTRDQTLATLLVERGQLQPEQVDDFEYNHVILQALGHKGGVDVDLGAVELAQGDVLLVCSDGLYGCVEHRILRETLGIFAPVEQIAGRLIELALAAGAPDNVTCIVARVVGPLDAREHEPNPKLRKVALPVADIAPTATKLTDATDDSSPSPLGRLRALLGLA